MIPLLIAVAAASLLGGLHCAGMCGPFALYAAAADGRVRAARLTAYHLGRLLTYLLVGVAVGLTGRAADASGEAVGLPAIAARAAGALLIVLAVGKLRPWLPFGGGKTNEPSAATGRLTRLVSRARPAITRLPAWLRPAGVGAVTTLLPCGWLYAFAIVAAGTGGVAAATLVMLAFWAGTVPWLSGLTLLARPLGARPALTRLVTAAALALAGLYTMTGRAAADFRPLLAEARAAVNVPGEAETAPRAAAETLDAVTTLPPPCCRHAAADAPSDAPAEAAR